MDDLGETHYFWKHSNIIFMERNSPILSWSHPRFLQRFARIFVPKASFSPFPWQLTSTHTHTIPIQNARSFPWHSPPNKKTQQPGYTSLRHEASNITSTTSILTDAPSEMSFSPGPIGRSLETLAEAPPTRNEGAVRMKKQQTAPQLLWGASRSVVVEVVVGF